MASYDSAIGAGDDNAYDYLGRGWALIDLKRYSEAVQAGARAIDLGEASGHTVQAYAYALQSRFGDARTAARLTLDADPTDKDAQNLLKRLAGL